MLSRYAIVLGAVFLVALGGAGGEGKTDLDRIQGAWKGTRLEVESKVAPGEFIEKCKYVFKGNVLTFFEEDKQVGKASFVLEPTKMPKAIDITPTEGQDKGKTMYGIYRIEGDTLSICIGEERPNDFRAVGKAGLIQFKRGDSK